MRGEWESGSRERSCLELWMFSLELKSCLSLLYL
jgi:hypothetical protein